MAGIAGSRCRTAAGRREARCDARRPKHNTPKKRVSRGTEHGEEEARARQRAQGAARKPSAVRPAKSPESARSSARSTVSGPSAKSTGVRSGATPRPGRWRRSASSRPRCPRTRPRPASTATRRAEPRAGCASRAARSRGHRQYADRDQSVGEGRVGRASRRASTRRTGRSIACARTPAIVR